MTEADDKLRIMLDVRGVKWDSVFDDDTSWKGRYGIKWRWSKDEDSATSYLFARVTPEQAIAATLGGNKMKHVFVDYQDNELCIVDDAGREAIEYIRELDGLIADITADKDDITSEDEARIFAMSYAVQCSVNTLCKALGVKLSKFDIISGHFTS